MKDQVTSFSLAHAPAQRLSDQDIMSRYRMTPPARGRCPAPRNAERFNVRQRRAEDVS